MKYSTYLTKCWKTSKQHSKNGGYWIVLYCTCTCPISQSGNSLQLTWQIYLILVLVDKIENNRYICEWRSTWVIWFYYGGKRVNLWNSYENASNNLKSVWLFAACVNLFQGTTACPLMFDHLYQSNPYLKSKSCFCVNLPVIYINHVICFNWWRMDDERQRGTWSEQDCLWPFNKARVTSCIVTRRTKACLPRRRRNWH